MSSFSPKNEGMIDCYQINYTTCHQLDPKLSSTHCSLPVNDGQRERCSNNAIFGPGSSFRVIADPRSDHNHVYDMPHRRNQSGRLEVSDDTVGPVLVALSSSNGLDSCSHISHHLVQESSQSFNSRPVSPSQPESMSQSREEEDVIPSSYNELQQIPHRIEFVHLFECS